MHTDRKSTITAMCKHSLSFAQFEFLKLLYYEDTALILQMNECQRPWTKTMLVDLVDRGYIRNDRKDGKWIITDFSPVVPKCVQLFGPLVERGIEFWESYPKTMYIDGRQVSTKSCDKHELIRIYDETISGSKHNRIMRALEYAIKRDLIRMGIEKWFKSEQWEVVEEEMKRLALANAKDEDHVF